MYVRARARMQKENQCELRVASCASPQNMITENQCELRVASCA